MRNLTLVLVLVGVASLGGVAYGEKTKVVRAAVSAAQTFESSKQDQTGRWVVMHKHSIAGIRFGKLTAHEALVRVIKGKSVVLTPMQNQRRYVGNGMAPMTVEAKARPSAKVRSAKELATWASRIGLRYLSFKPEKKLPPPAPLPAIRFPIGVRGLDYIAPYSMNSKEPPPPSMIRGLY